MNLKSLVAGLVCLVGAGVASAAGEMTGTTADYAAQEDLVACWDGVENAGFGLHENAATVWTDVKRGVTLTLPDRAVVEANAMNIPPYLSEASQAVTLSPSDLPGTAKADVFTVELCMQSTGFDKSCTDVNNLQYLVNTTRGTIGYRTLDANGLYVQKPKSSTQTALFNWKPKNVNVADLHTLTGAFCVNTPDNSKIYLDASAAVASSDLVNSKYDSNFRTSWIFFGAHWCGIRVCSIRVYKRALTAAERTRNHQVDDYRFVQGMAVSSGKLAILGEPSEFGAVTPSYGVVDRDYAAGESVTCKAPAFVSDAARGMRSVCAGYQVRTNGVVYVEGTFEGEGEREVTFDYPDCETGAQFVWQWAPEYSLTVVSAGHATVEIAGDGWFAPGEVVQVTAKPDEGYAFGRWTGAGLDGQHKFDNPYAFVMGDTPPVLTANVRKVVYVSKTGNDENGGTSWDDALATVPVALAKEESPFVLVGEGRYDIQAAISVAKGATICGSGNRGTVFRLTKALPTTSDATQGALNLSHAGARLSNLALSTGGVAYGRGVYMTGGQVDNCSITNCKTVLNKANGGGVYMTGGVVRNCRIAGNIANSSGNSQKEGGGVYMTDGLVETCTIANNAALYTSTSGSGHGGGVSMTGGTLRNCLVSDNRSLGGSTSTPGVYAKNASTIENCTVVKNAYKGDTPECAGIYAGGTTVVRNSIVLRNTNSSTGEANVYRASGAKFDNVCTTDEAGTTGVISGDPAFVDEAKGDWRIGYSAFCVDVADPSAWALLTTDLGGGERVIGGKIDVGCYEFAPSGLSCGLEIATDGALDEAQVTLTGSVIGAQPETVTFAWTFTDSLGVKTERSGLGLDSLVLPMPTGVYTVKLVASKGTDADEKTGSFTVFAKDLYVSPNGSNELPFGSFDTAATNLCDVIALAGDGTTIHLADGTYRIKSSIVLSAATVLTHDGERENCIVTGNTGSFLFTLDNAGARIENIDVCGQYPRLSVNGKTGASGASSYSTLNGVRINNGLVTNCIVESCYGAVDGAGVTLLGGKLVDSVIRGNYAFSSGGGGRNGGGVCVNGGLVDRCTITNNVSGMGGMSTGGGLRMNGGTVRNSVIAGNWSVEAGGVEMNPFTSATLESCTVVGNVASGTGKAGGLDANNSSKVINTIIWNNTNTTDKVLREKTGGATFDTCWTSDPVFKPHGAPWRLHKTSPCRNAGKPFSWMDTARDFYGNPRILLDAPDIGAVEMPHDLGLIIFIE